MTSIAMTLIALMILIKILILLTYNLLNMALNIKNKKNTLTAMAQYS